MSKIAIYTSDDGHVQLNVNIAHETIWLSQQQMADLFGTKRQAITKHLRNIFAAGELEKQTVCSKMEHTAKDGKTYKTKFYSLDAIISVGYRVNSKQATKFRIWATQILKDHLVRGYTIRKERLAEQGIKELQETVELLRKTLIRHELIEDLGSESFKLIINYARTWHLLLAYDENKLKIPKKGSPIINTLNYHTVIQAIDALKADLFVRSEATELFGQDRNRTLNGILQSIEQTFDDQPLYVTAEERAAHLLYFIIKDHPFVDGNERIGSLIFLLYLRLQNISIRFNENGLVALALLIAESKPSQKDIMIKLIVNLSTELMESL